MYITCQSDLDKARIPKWWLPEQTGLGVLPAVAAAGAGAGTTGAWITAIGSVLSSAAGAIGGDDEPSQARKQGWPGGTGDRATTNGMYFRIGLAIRGSEFSSPKEAYGYNQEMQPKFKAWTKGWKSLRKWGWPHQSKFLTQIRDNVANNRPMLHGFERHKYLKSVPQSMWNKIHNEVYTPQDFVRLGIVPANVALRIAESGRPTVITPSPSMTTPPGIVPTAPPTVQPPVSTQPGTMPVAPPAAPTTAVPTLIPTQPAPVTQSYFFGTARFNPGMVAAVVRPLYFRNTQTGEVREIDGNRLSQIQTTPPWEQVDRSAEKYVEDVVSDVINSIGIDVPATGISLPGTPGTPISPTPPPTQHVPPSSLPSANGDATATKGRVPGGLWPVALLGAAVATGYAVYKNAG